MSTIRSFPSTILIQIFHLLPLKSFLDTGNFLKIQVNLISYVSGSCFVKHAPTFLEQGSETQALVSCLVPRS